MELVTSSSPADALQEVGLELLFATAKAYLQQIQSSESHFFPNLNATSSAAAMDKAIPESKALRPRNPAIADENDWPEFQLRNVEVTARNGRLASLLHADPNCPVTVTGTLELERGKAHLCESILSKLRAASCNNC